MSSTNRSNARDNHISDYYITPQKPIIDLFNVLKEQEPTRHLFLTADKLNPEMKYLDSCAGGDDKNDMSYPKLLSSFGIDAITYDIRQDSKASIKQDFLTVDIDVDEAPWVVITNPPFNIAESIINKSLEIVDEGGYVIMLLRLNFFGSRKRKAFWKNNMPILTIVHHERISFTGGQTDSIEYMHCVWRKGQKQDFTTLIIV